MMSDIQYVKVLNEEAIHHGFKYRRGLNVLNVPFEKYGSCVPGGLYFTTLKHIHKFFDYGEFLVEVFLPTEDPEFCMIMDPDGDKFRANKIILGDKYSLSSPETFVKFGIINKIPPLLIRKQLDKHNIKFIQWLEYHNYSFCYIGQKYHNCGICSMGIILDYAISNGSLKILEWFKKSKYLGTYDSHSINFALINGHTHILDWLIEMGCILRFSQEAINTITANKNIKVLAWLEKYPHIIRSML